MSPCLQTFVVALPASGKGVLSLVRLLAEPIHDEIRGQVDESMACYRREKAKYAYLAEAERSSFAARGSMSSGRSRSGGTVHSNTFSL